MLLTSCAPERTSWSGQEADDASLERLTSSSLHSSMPSDSGLEPLAAHIQQMSHVRRSRELLSPGASSNKGTEYSCSCVAHNLTAFSLMECSKVTDQELAEFFSHTKNLEFVSLVPDDYVTSAGMSSAHDEEDPSTPKHPVQLPSHVLGLLSEHLVHCSLLFIAVPFCKARSISGAPEQGTQFLSWRAGQTISRACIHFIRFYRSRSMLCAIAVQHAHEIQSTYGCRLELSHSQP